MSDAYEALATPTPGHTEGDAGPDSGGSSAAAPIDSSGSPSGETLVHEETGATRPKRAPRRTSSRARRVDPPSDVAPAAEAVHEQAAPASTPRRRRPRKASAQTDPAAANGAPPPSPAAHLDRDAPTAEPEAVIKVPPDQADGPAIHPSEAAPTSELMRPEATEHLLGSQLEPPLVDLSETSAWAEEGASEPAGMDQSENGRVALDPAVVDETSSQEAGDAEAEAEGSAPKRRRSRRGSRGGRRSRARRAAADPETRPVEESETVADAAAGEGEPPAGMAAASDQVEPTPVFESPLPDVMVHFRPVARKRPGAAPAVVESEGLANELATEGTEPAVREAAPEGEPASRGRRRRRRGERVDREERTSGVGGALPPRSDRGEPKEALADAALPAADAAPETSAERPKVERVGRGQRGERVLERAAARAERDAARAAEKDADKAERLTKEIVINVSPRETRIAVLENGRLVELHVEREERVVGGVFKGKVANVLPGMDAAFVDIGLERNAWLHVGDILYEGGEETAHAHRRPRDLKIRDVAKPGQEILVQVVKGPRGTKGARVSTRMSLPGRYIVLMPDADNLGVSRKIEDPAERERLKRLGERLRPAGFGMIIRTEAEERTEEDLKQDLDLLLQQWTQITDRSRQVKSPALIHQDLSLILKTIRDVFGADVDKLILDSSDDYEKVREMLAILSPDLIDRVQLYQEPEPIFSRYGLEDEIERLLRRKVWLRSGGYITIDPSEALTAIDVNTGKFVGSTSLSDTILKTNLDAVQEIARQLRLRDIGGMIVLDFIDMSSARDRAQVMAALDKALKKDRTRTKVAHISPLGLIEMTRKRTGETVTDLITQSCEYCQGRGRTLSPETMSIQIERAVRRKCAENDYDAVLVHAHPEVCAHLIGPEGENVEAIERLLRRPIYVRARHDFHIEKFEVLPCEMMEVEKQLLPFRGGQVVECEVQKMELITAPRSAAWVDGYFVDLANGTRFQGSKIRVRLTDVRRSFALGEPVAPATALDKSEPI
jgi:ribonuclease G